LDRGAARRAADLLLRHIEDAHWKGRGTALPHKVLQCVIGHVGAGLHIVDAGPEHLVALAPEDMRGRKAADRVHGVEMAEDQDSWLVVAIPGRLCLENVAIALAPGRAGDAGTDASEMAFHDIHEAVDRGAVVARCLDLDPAADTIENLLAVEGRDVRIW